jgi:hypothetical protein
VPQEVEPTTAPRERQSQGDLIETIRAIKNLMRRVRTALDGIRRDQEVAIDDAINLCVTNLRGVCRHEPVHMSVTTNETMKKADDALQKEIAFVLNTLSADSASLDLALRAIRAKCNGIEESASIEATGAWAIRLAEWRLQICEAHATFVRARL